MDIVYISFILEDETTYNIEAAQFGINISQEDESSFTATSFYKNENLIDLKALLLKNILEIVVKNAEGEIIYTSTDWHKVISMSIHYNNFYKKMTIDYVIGAE